MEPKKGRDWKEIFTRLQYCDQRYIYLFFFIIVSIFVVISERVKIPMPIRASESVMMLYRKIEEAPDDKIILIDSNWGVDIRAESEGQMRSVIEHIMRRRLKFAIISWIDNPQGQKNGYDIAADLARKHGYDYGTDWVAWAAIKLTGGAELQALSKDIHDFVKADINGIPLGDLSVMDNIRNIYDVHLVYSVCYDFGGVPWLGFVQGIYGTNYAIGVSAITSSTAYSYIESGQICGMLSGATGAAEYEHLLDMPDDERFAKSRVIVLSMATIYILIMIVMGNVFYYLGGQKPK